MLLLVMAYGRLFRIYARTHDIGSGFGLRADRYSLKMHPKHKAMYPHGSHYCERAKDRLDYREKHL